MASLMDSSLGLTVAQLILYAPAELVVIVASFFLFDIRKKGCFAALTFALFVANTLAAPMMSAALEAFLGVAILVVPQLLFSRDAFSRKAFTAVVMQIAVVIAEVPPSLYWVGITDVVPTSAQALLEYGEYLLLARAVHVVSLCLLLFGEYRAQQLITGHRTDRGALLFIWMLLLQYFMVALGVYSIELNQAFSKAAALGLTLICLICLLADIACFVLLDYYNRRERDRWRMAFHQAELDRYLKAYGKIEHEVSVLASVRHDLRNHVNVILYLLDKRDTEAAASHIREMIEGLDAVEESSVHDVESLGFECADLGARHQDEGTSLEGFGLPGEPGAAAGTAVPRKKAASKPSAYSSLRRNLVAVFPVSQIAVALFLFFCGAANDMPVWFYLVDVVACALCFVVDAVLYYYLDLAFKQGDLEVKALILEEQALVQKHYYERLSMELTEAQRSRQDLRCALRDLEVKLSSGDSVDVRGTFGSVILAPVFNDKRFCENRVVNALVSIKAGVCADEGIDFDCSINVPEDLPVSTVDLCALFSNMLDNALQACLQLEEGKRHIKLRASHAAGVFVVTMENSCTILSEPSSRGGEGERSVADAWDLVRLVGIEGPRGSRRSRRDRLAESVVRAHGWGLRILKDMSERYDGSFSAVYEEDGIFRTSAMLILDSSKL